MHVFLISSSVSKTSKYSEAFVLFFFSKYFKNFPDLKEVKKLLFCVACIKCQTHGDHLSTNWLSPFVHPSIHHTPVIIFFQILVPARFTSPRQHACIQAPPPPQCPKYQCVSWVWAHLWLEIRSGTSPFYKF